MNRRRIPADVWGAAAIVVALILALPLLIGA